jgi:broad specificity phosphatase PhoE
VLILVRHGESTGNAAGLLLGRLDAPLTDRGRSQAAAIGPVLGPVTRVVSSPLTRARATAEALGTGLPVEVDDRWIEVDYGEFDGQSLGAVPAEVWTSWRADPDFRPPGGETLSEAGTRVRAACEELFAVEGEGARGPGAVVVVSHVSPIKAAAGWALGLGDVGAWRLYLATGSVTRIGWRHGQPVLHQFNRTPWDPGD